MMRWFSLWIFLHVAVLGTNGIIVPDEIPTALSVIYSNIPKIKIGTDSRIGWGFRFGDRADAQILLELGPQQETQRLANQQPFDNPNYPELTSSLDTEDYDDSPLEDSTSNEETPQEEPRQEGKNEENQEKIEAEEAAVIKIEINTMSNLLTKLNSKINDLINVNHLQTEVKVMKDLMFTLEEKIQEEQLKLKNLEEDTTSPPQQIREENFEVEELKGIITKLKNYVDKTSNIEENDKDLVTAVEIETLNKLIKRLSNMTNLNDGVIGHNRVANTEYFHTVSRTEPEVQSEPSENSKNIEFNSTKTSLKNEGNLSSKNIERMIETNDIGGSIKADEFNENKKEQTEGNYNNKTNIEHKINPDKIIESENKFNNNSNNKQAMSSTKNNETNEGKITTVSYDDPRNGIETKTESSEIHENDQVNKTAATFNKIIKINGEREIAQTANNTEKINIKSQLLPIKNLEPNNETELPEEFLSDQSILSKGNQPNSDKDSEFSSSNGEILEKLKIKLLTEMKQLNDASEVKKNEFMKNLKILRIMEEEKRKEEIRKQQKLKGITSDRAQNGMIIEGPYKGVSLKAYEILSSLWVERKIMPGTIPNVSLNEKHEQNEEFDDKKINQMNITRIVAVKNDSMHKNIKNDSKIVADNNKSNRNIVRKTEDKNSIEKLGVKNSPLQSIEQEYKMSMIAMNKAQTLNNITGRTRTEYLNKPDIKTSNPRTILSKETKTIQTKRNEIETAKPYSRNTVIDEEYRRSMLAMRKAQGQNYINENLPPNQHRNKGLYGRNEVTMKSRIIAPQFLTNSLVNKTEFDKKNVTATLKLLGGKMMTYISKVLHNTKKMIETNDKKKK